MRLIAFAVASVVLSFTAAVPNCDRPGCVNCAYEYEFRRCICDYCVTSPPSPPSPPASSPVVVPVTPPPSPRTSAPKPVLCGRQPFCDCYYDDVGECICPCNPLRK
ncbi:unnamed protein product [Aphanomyces euteiches]|nr:hypothetical protein Ae201684P_004947 [Aphanomyces euteiches]